MHAVYAPRPYLAVGFAGQAYTACMITTGWWGLRARSAIGRRRSLPCSLVLRGCLVLSGRRSLLLLPGLRRERFAGGGLLLSPCGRQAPLTGCVPGGGRL